MSRDVDYLVISDIHLGNRKNSTREIIANLDRYFDNYTSKSPFSQLDAIFLAGDIFEDLLDFASDDIHEIILWLHRLMSFCARFNIILRVLEGTPSHDWKQAKITETICKIAPSELDFRYIETLYIEYIESLDLHVLYVPDEYTNDTDLTFQHVQKLLAENHLEQVDIAIMHGMFDYQATWLK